MVDLIVVGGGPAGTGAALAAARTGASVLLIERTECLGGMATSGGLAMFGPLDNGRRNQDDWTRFRLDRAGQPYPPELARGMRVLKGIPEEVVERLQAIGAAEVPRYGYVSFNMEAMKFLLETLLGEAGVTLRYGTLVAGAEETADGVTLTLADKRGLSRVAAPLVVDATGDGDVAHHLHAEIGLGRDSDGQLQGVTLMYRLGGVTADMLDLLPDSPLSAAMEAAAEAAFARGDYTVRPGIGCVTAVPGMPGVVAINQQHTFGIDGTDAEARTRAVVRGRAQIQELARFYREHVPGFEHSFLLDTAPQLGVRETRRVLGDYVLTKDDVQHARAFPDGVCQYGSIFDIHVPSKSEEVWWKKAPSGPPPGTAYEIPYRCLLPRGLSRVLTAGRCVSATHEALGAFRLMSCCMALGQAAGTAAALAGQAGLLPRALSAETLRTRLRADGVLI
jgi:hypothetical protein